MQDDLSYFSRRAAQERSAAASAADAKARRAHQQMADHYQALIRAAGEPDMETTAPATA